MDGEQISPRACGDTVEEQEMEILRSFDSSAELRIGFFCLGQVLVAGQGMGIMSFFLIDFIVFNGSAICA